MGIHKKRLPFKVADFIGLFLFLFLIFILNGTGKTKLAILPFLCSREIVKNYSSFFRNAQS